MRPLLILLLAGIVPFASPAAESRTFRSGPEAVPLLELFTSEGCSSCPPAEAWLAELRHDPGLWREFVPVAWHVTYWDRLGWPDRFAEPAYSERQYAYARSWGNRRVYTPEVVRGGVEWSWRDGRAIAENDDEIRGGDLMADVLGHKVRVSFKEPAEAVGPWEVHVAFLGGGMVSDVKRGENRGRRLEHEFGVLDWQSVPLRDGRATIAIPEVPADLTVVRRALAVWVSRRGDPVPLQAAGGWLE